MNHQHHAHTHSHLGMIPTIHSPNGIFIGGLWKAENPNEAQIDMVGTCRTSHTVV